jgi:glucose-1-phosphatase
MPIQAVIWDLGGVILRTEDAAPRLQLAERLGMPRYDLEELVFHSPSGMRAQLGEISVEQHWENIRRELNLTEQEMPTVREAFWGGDRIDTRLLEDIRGLRPRVRLGLLSNAFSDLRQAISEYWGFSDVFDTLVISAEIGIMKPDARIYRLALERLKVQPGEAVFIDDFPRNVEGARALGIPAILFQNRQQAWQELQALLADAV